MKEHQLDPNEFILDEIVNIQCIGDQNTVDITVEGTHMFFANDIYTHNSGAQEEIVQAHHISDSFRKIMTADVILSFSRGLRDKANGTAKFHMIKNRFGSDGMSFNARMDANTGRIDLHNDQSDEGKKIEQERGSEEEAQKNLLTNRWTAFKNNGGAKNGARKASF